MAAAEPHNHASFVDDSADVRVVASFDDMPLHQALLRGIYSHGFERPSAIQQRAVVPLIRGGDVIAQAQSGTGKTGAFSIGLLQRVDWRRRGQLQALVLSPTRELAAQTRDVIAALGEFAAEHEAFCQAFVGGTRLQDDLQRMRAGVAVAVGTPGRVADLIRRGALRTDTLRIVVLDEADEMLSQGFAEQIFDIFRYLPRDVQVALFSATLPDDVLALAGRFMRAPTRILVHREQLTLDGIKQFYVALDEADKLATLVDLYESLSVAQSVIFANAKRTVDFIADHLNRQGHTVSFMHADMAKGERERVMATFRSGSSRVLVTTDLVARGIDVHHVNMVVNYDLPVDRESYLHRIGRGGRYGRKGVAINLVAPGDVAALRGIQQHYHTQVDELPMDFAAYLGE
jgi:translation initiation factor 4A